MSIAKKLSNMKRQAKGRLEETVGKKLKDDDLIVEGKANAASARLARVGKKAKNATRKLAGK